jgi:hypothetical protein
MCRKWVVCGQFVLNHKKPRFRTVEVDQITVRDVLGSALSADLFLDVDVDPIGAEHVPLNLDDRCFEFGFTLVGGSPVEAFVCPDVRHVC